MDHWKDYDAADVTHSVSHHLAAIAQLHQRQGYARAVDVARLLDITRGSVSIALKSLKSKGLVTEDRNRFLLLSDEGHEIVERIQQRRRIVRRFFEDVLGVDDEQSESDACKIEHLLSDEVCRRLKEFLDGRSKRQGKSRRPVSRS
ncbi:MAG: metal-dependent transcriptional regulator [Phycisphaerae bacterium]|nr:metal-dependent transcriptional regulator [Phycisphaerae bacterium]